MSKVKFYHITYVAAVILSLLAAYFSIYGFSYLFAGAKDQIRITMLFLEIVNIILVSSIPRWKNISKAYMVIFCIAIIILTTLTSAGVYGYFSNAYMSTSQKISIISDEDGITKNQIVNIDFQIKSLREEIETNKQRFTTLNNARNAQESRYSSALEKNYSTGKYKGDIDNTKIELNILTESNSKINDKISDLLKEKLKLQKDSVESNKQIANIDIGPLRFLSKVFNCDINSVVNIIILFITIVFHPLAIILNLATSIMMTKDKEIVVDEKLEDEIQLKESTVPVVEEEIKIKKKRKKRKPNKKKDDYPVVNGIEW